MEACGASSVSLQTPDCMPLLWQREDGAAAAVMEPPPVDGAGLGQQRPRQIGACGVCRTAAIAGLAERAAEAAFLTRLLSSHHLGRLSTRLPPDARQVAPAARCRTLWLAAYCASITHSAVTCCCPANHMDRIAVFRAL